MSAIPVATRWQAMNELYSLRIHAKRTGCDIVEMIRLEPDVEDAMEAYCKAYPGQESEDVRKSLDMRDYMLGQLTPQEWFPR